MPKERGPRLDRKRSTRGYPLSVKNGGVSCLEETEQDRQEQVPERGEAVWADSAWAPVEIVCARTVGGKRPISVARRAPSSSARAVGPQ